VRWAVAIFYLPLIESRLLFLEGACVLARGKRAMGMSSVQEGCLDLGPGITEEQKVD
jgi:hypothetical protein